MIAITVCNSFAFVDAELSHNRGYHCYYVGHRNRAVFYEARYCPKVHESCFINVFYAIDDGFFRLYFALELILIVSAGVQLLFFNFACRALVIFDTSFYCAFCSMGLPAPEWAPQIGAAGVAGMG